MSSSSVEKVVIPYRRPVKPVYVRDALKAIDEVMRHDHG